MEKVVIIDLFQKSEKNNEAARMKLAKEVHYNNILFNVKCFQTSNLMRYEGREIFKKTPAEKNALKIAKAKYKLTLIKNNMKND